MENDFLNFNSLDNKDIAKYLATAFEHLNQIIMNLNLLSQNACEKEHVIDILNECVYIKEELTLLIQDYQTYDNEDSFNKIQGLINNLFSIEEELISDYPYLFNSNNSNTTNNNNHNNNQWWIYSEPITTTTKITPQTINSDSIELKRYKINLKRWAFGLFFLFPAFMFIIFYPLINHKINNLEEYDSKEILLEHDRAYKNIFYLYSAVLASKEQNNNFYSLLKSTSFQMPEGFGLIDKNLMVDYYLKEYYSLDYIQNLDIENDILDIESIENDTKSNPDNNSFTIISVTNLNFHQCKYILTKFSGISISKIITNEQEVEFDNNFKAENYCYIENNKNNTLSFYILKTSHNE